MKPVVALLRERGIRLIIYLDDLLILCDCPKALKIQVALIKDLFQSLGLLINEKKLQLIPTQEIVFLGLGVSTSQLEVSLPKEKVVSDPEGSQTFAFQDSNHSAASRDLCGNDDGSKTSNFNWPIVSSSPSSSDKQSGAIGCITGGSETVLP